ncbi:hypothetical protein [Nocardioides sp.]|uniref:hypothetical protein n=1 Tax=Nocardioides sp. TaxID=35761 RepID=UPI0035B443A3
MDDRLKRTVALLLAGGLVLVVVGLALVLQHTPEPVSYRVEGLYNGPPLPELDAPHEGADLRLLAGGVVAVGGALMALTGAVATGVWLGSARRGDDV